MSELGKVPATVLIVDDDPLVRQALNAQLKETPQLSVVGTAGDGEEAVAAVRSLQPTVVLLDLRMPGKDGLWALRRIRETTTRTRVIVLTAWNTDDNVEEAVASGADGFLLKDSPPEDVIAAVLGDGVSVAYDDAVLESMASSYRERAQRRREAREVLDRLSPTEREVAEAVADGRSNSDIAKARYMSVGSVKACLVRIFDKLGTSNRVQVAGLVLDARQ